MSIRIRNLAKQPSAPAVVTTSPEPSDAPPVRINLRQQRKEQREGRFDKVMESMLAEAETNPNPRYIKDEVTGISPLEQERLDEKKLLEAATADITKILKGLPKEFCLRQPSTILAGVLDHFDYEDGSSGLLEDTANAFMGRKVAEMIPDLVRMADWLHQIDATEKGPWDLGYRDRLAFSLANEGDLKVMVLVRQSNTILTLMERFSEHSPWEVHLRLLDARKPDFTDLLATDFITRDEQSSRLFRYMDSRDHGYLASLEWIGGVPEVKDAMSGYGNTAAALYTLKDAVLTMNEATGAEPESE